MTTIPLFEKHPADGRIVQGVNYKLYPFAPPHIDKKVIAKEFKVTLRDGRVLLVQKSYMQTLHGDTCSWFRKRKDALLDVIVLAGIVSPGWRAETIVPTTESY